MLPFRRRNWRAIIRNQLQHPRTRRFRSACSAPLLVLAVVWLWIGGLIGDLAAVIAGDDPDDITD